MGTREAMSWCCGARWTKIPSFPPWHAVAQKWLVVRPSSSPCGPLPLGSHCRLAPAEIPSSFRPPAAPATLRSNVALLCAGAAGRRCRRRGGGRQLCGRRPPYPPRSLIRRPGAPASLRRHTQAARHGRGERRYSPSLPSAQSQPAEEEEADQNKDIPQILQEAQNRWLRPKEICQILSRKLSTRNSLLLLSHQTGLQVCQRHLRYCQKNLGISDPKGGKFELGTSMMPGFGTNAAMGSASLPARVEYNTSNGLSEEYIYDQGLSYPATNGYAYYADLPAQEIAGAPVGEATAIGLASMASRREGCCPGAGYSREGLTSSPWLGIDRDAGQEHGDGGGLLEPDPWAQEEASSSSSERRRSSSGGGAREDAGPLARPRRERSPRQGREAARRCEPARSTGRLAGTPARGAGVRQREASRSTGRPAVRRREARESAGGKLGSIPIDRSGCDCSCFKIPRIKLQKNVLTRLLASNSGRR